MAEKSFSTIIYLKNSRVFCPGCGEHVATFKHDLFYGQIIYPDHFEDHEGQGPWKLGESMVCRKCQSLWIPQGLYKSDAIPPNQVVHVHRGDYSSLVSQAEFQQGRAGRQATVIATVMDIFHNYAEQYGDLSELDAEVYAILRGHLTSEIHMFNKERVRLAGGTH